MVISIDFSAPRAHSLDAELSTHAIGGRIAAAATTQVACTNQQRAAGNVRRALCLGQRQTHGVAADFGAWPAVRTIRRGVADVVALAHGACQGASAVTVKDARAADVDLLRRTAASGQPYRNDHQAKNARCRHFNSPASFVRRARRSYHRTAAGRCGGIEPQLSGRDGKKWAIEVKRSLSPTVGRGFHSGCADLHPTRKLIVYPGNERLHVTATPCRWLRSRARWRSRHSISGSNRRWPRRCACANR